MAVSKDAVWVTISSQNQVRQLRAKGNTVGYTVNVKEPCSGLVAAFGSLWIPSCGDHALVRVSLKSGKVQATIPVAPADSEGGITAGFGSVWMATSSTGSLARIDAHTNKVITTIAVPSGSFCPIVFPTTSGSPQPNTACSAKSVPEPIVFWPASPWARIPDF